MKPSFAPQAFRARPARFALPILAALLAGCAADRTGALTAGAPLPAAAPRVSGLERAASREHSRLVAAFGGEYDAPAAERLLEEIVARIVPAAGQPGQSYRVTILNSPVVNAFALPTGNIYVTRGLLALANDPSEVAAVLAHEIAHVTANHAIARAELEQRSVLVSRVVAEVLNDPGAGQTMRNEQRVSLASFSRAQELEADRIGVKTIGKAGFDPYGASRFLIALGRNANLRAATTGSVGAKQGLGFLSSHPTTPERIAQSLVAAREFQSAAAAGADDRPRYLAALEGLVYGDDPAEGLVRGRSFVHPGLAIGFTAPEGFSLENGSQAVLGVAAGGGQALRFDGVQAPAGQSLESFLASGWIEGLETGSIETTTVNGLPAALATAKGKEWSFRLGAVKAGDTIYRLLFATRAPTQGTERDFREAIDSIRTLTPDEVRAIRPMRIGLVTAREGDTVESLIRDMAQPVRSAERFRLLNGLERTTPLRSGQSYKTVIE